MNQETNQLTLSYELLHLIQWLIENEPEKLKALIADALDNGLRAELKQVGATQPHATADDMRYNLIDLLGLLESLLHEVTDEHTMKRMKEKKLMPAIDQIDTSECDEDVVQCSIEKASYKLERNPQGNPQEILLKELLRCWKPTKETIAN